MQVGMLDLLIKSHWYKCSVSLEGAHLGITLDDDIDIITSQGDTDITIPSDVPPGVTCDKSVIIVIRIKLNSRLTIRKTRGSGQQVWGVRGPGDIHQGGCGEQDAHPDIQDIPGHGG